MANTLTNRTGARVLRRSKALGEAELYALFQLLPTPALLVDNFKEKIVLANSPFLQMTAFSLNELTGRMLNTLIAGLPAHALAADEMLSLMLDRRTRPPLPVNVQVHALDTQGQWLSLIFEPQDRQNKSLLARLEEIVNALVELNHFREGESLRQTLERSLTKVCNVLEITCAGIYRVDQGDANMWLAAQSGEGGILPSTLPPSDLMRLSQTFIWRPGRRVQTELHRTARMQNLAFLASTPISQNSLLVLADRQHEPSEHLLVGLEVIGKQFSGLLDHLAQVMELRRQTLENRRALSIWRSVQENSQEGVLLVTPELTVSEMNPAAEWMLGYADWEVKGQPVENILISPDRLTPALETACEGIPTHNMGSISLHRRNGQSFPVHMQVIPVQREGETLAIIIFFSDVSEHIEIAARTMQLEQRALLGEVTAVFAHEVRNPINNISTGLQLLSARLPQEDTNQENINRLLHECDRIDHLMESVLNFSRQVEHKFEPVDMETLLRRLLDRWRPRMSKVSVLPYFQIEPGTSKVLGDPRSLEQVFTNLISNAVEAMSANNGGTLAIRVSPLTVPHEKPQVLITVSDSGPGIPEDLIGRIFEPFLTTKTQGTGLGLAITKRIVTAHHGFIEVKSFPGGTVFQVKLLAYQGETE